MLTGLGLDGRLGLSLDELTELGLEGLRLGYKSLWTPQGGMPEAFLVCDRWVVASAKALREPARTGIGVVPARSSHPVALAASARTLSAASSGRFVLGIGTGATSGLRGLEGGERPVAFMREFLTAVRALTKGEAARYRSIELGALSRAGDVPTDPVPIYLAALGPRMIALAGELADGVLLNWSTPSQVAWARAELARAAKKSGRDPASVKVASYVRMSVDEDLDAARRALGVQVLSYAMNRSGDDPHLGYRAHFSRMGFDAVLRELEERRDRGATLMELVSSAPDELLSSVAYFGAPKDAPKAFSSLAEGLDEAVMRVIGTPERPDAARTAVAALAPGDDRSKGPRS